MQLNPKVSLASMPGSKNQDCLEIRMYTSKTKQHINSSINCFSKQRSPERPGHLCDRKKHVTIYLTASINVCCRDQAEVHLSKGAGEAAALRPQPTGGGFLHCAQQTTSQEKKSHWDQLGEGILQSWTSQIWAALLKELHHLLHLKSQPQLQSFSDYTDSATHWSIIFFRQWPVITLPAHPNLQLYSKKVKQNSRSYF